MQDLIKKKWYLKNNQICYCPRLRFKPTFLKSSTTLSSSVSHVSSHKDFLSLSSSEFIRPHYQLTSIVFLPSTNDIRTATSPSSFETHTRTHLTTMGSQLCFQQLRTWGQTEKISRPVLPVHVSVCVRVQVEKGTKLPELSAMGKGFSTKVLT